MESTLRVSEFKSKKTSICSPDMVFKKILELTDIKCDRENFITVLLDGENKPTCATIEFVGGRDRVTVDKSLTFKNAIIKGSVSMIIAHNHPDFEVLKPSKGDLELTKELKKAAKILDIEILDHLIFNEKKFYSMRSEGDM